MDDRFVPLATYLRATASADLIRTACESAAPAPAPAPSAAYVAPAASAPPSSGDLARVSIVEDLTLMRLAAMESFERRAQRAIAALANDVLARELALAPADIESLVREALAALADHEPVALGIPTADRERMPATTLPLRHEPTLEAGDFVVYVRDGSFESSFALRLAAVLETSAARDAR